MIELDIADGLATLTLARPEAGNAMDWTLIDAFASACERIAAAGTARAVLILGQGKNFCVGGDIRRFESEPDPAAYIRRLAERLHQGIETLAALSAPVVVGARGAAAGAGLSLAASGDIVIAGRGSSFSMAYSALGLTADGGATWLLPRLIGLRRAQEMAFTNRRLTAGEAERYGLVTRVVDDATVEDEARVVALALAAGPTVAFGRIKRLFARSHASDLATQLAEESTAIGAAMATEDARGAVAAFLERRIPVFYGR